MARATVVYVVLDNWVQPVAAFTVKHELVTWLRRRHPNDDRVTVWRVADGGDARRTVLDVAGLLGVTDA